MSACVRFAQPRDLHAIEQVENNSDRLLIDLLKPDVWSPAPAGEDRASEPGFLLVVELDDGHIAGFVHVLEFDGICHLEQLSVELEHGRQGLGRTLIEAAKHLARKRGYERISLRTYADIPWNAPLYKTAGFVEEAPTTQFDRALAGTDAEIGLERYGRRVQMAARLAPPRP